ncbi:hypothetical protein HDV02_005861 [Globomyces sp. JEL0801]|nr:hypothetical protein HDV02_005861 [Globomyces sp. JEL0801]
MLATIRGFAQSQWIDTVTQTQVSPFNSENGILIFPTIYLMLSLSSFFTLWTSFAVRLRSRGWKIKPCTILACDLVVFLLAALITFQKAFPINKYHYSIGGFNAIVTACLSNFVAFTLFLSDVLVFNKIAKHQTMEQKKHEVAHYIFNWYIIIGAFAFMFLEHWSFERAGEFCLMTLLTIGYGNIVPKTFYGRLVMIVYTSVGLIGTYGLLNGIVAEDVVEEEESNGEDCSDANASDYEDENSSNLAPLPLTMSYTGDSILSTNTERTRKTYENSTLRGVVVVISILMWWVFSSCVFSYFENWTFFEGDFTLNNPVAIEFWWFFLFNAMSIIVYVLQLAGSHVARRIAKRQEDHLKQRKARQLKRKLRAQQQLTAMLDLEHMENSMSNGDLAHGNTFPSLRSPTRRVPANRIFVT